MEMLESIKKIRINIIDKDNIKYKNLSISQNSSSTSYFYAYLMCSMSELGDPNIMPFVNNLIRFDIRATRCRE